MTSLDPDLYQGLMFVEYYPWIPEDLSLNLNVVDEGEILHRIDGFGAQYMRRIWHCADGWPQTKRN